jgi:LmbE family N-acetylglucosaminyl deacetylase
MLDSQKEVSRRVPDGRYVVQQARRRSARRVRVALNIIEDLLTVATASVVLALVLELGNVSIQAQAESSRGVAGKPTFAHLLANAGDGSAHTAHVTNSITAANAKRQGDPTGCQTTVMNVVAHQDDDLLFINPDITHDIQRHDCVRTVYVTAGDDGRGTDYLLSREAGSEAAYDIMLGAAGPWTYHNLLLSSGATVTTASPDGNTDISLIFLRLPDGNLDGSGFPDTKNESIAKLEAGAIASITTVDGREKYTSAQLTATLEALIQYYAPGQLNTQSSDAGLDVADHSDHLTVSTYATLAATLYANQIHPKKPIHLEYFMGYPIRGMISNLSSTDTAEKAAAFFAYAVHDPGVCTSMEDCIATDSTYGLYLSRQYVTGH